MGKTRRVIDITVDSSLHSSWVRTIRAMMNKPGWLNFPVDNQSISINLEACPIQFIEEDKYQIMFVTETHKVTIHRC